MGLGCLLLTLSFSIIPGTEVSFAGDGASAEAICVRGVATAWATSRRSVGVAEVSAVGDCCSVRRASCGVSLSRVVVGSALTRAAGEAIRHLVMSKMSLNFLALFRCALSLLNRTSHHIIRWLQATCNHG